MSIGEIELLDRSRILAELAQIALTGQELAVHLEVFTEIDSTNQYALEKSEVAVPFFACLAEYQSAGRGRQGRSWISPFGSGLCLSLRYQYRGLRYSLGGLNIALGVTLAKVLTEFGAIDVKLKWPNDLFWQGRKLAGLLLESVSRAQQTKVVVGVGINVNMPPEYSGEITQPWIDLNTVLEREISRNVLAAHFIAQMAQTLMIYANEGLTPFLPEWERFDLIRNQWVTLAIPDAKKQTKKIVGKALGIDEEGALLLQTPQGKQRYVWGEVSVQL